MRILSIETSCDETAIALLDITGPLEKPDIKVLGNSLYSQVKVHEQYGGVYPMLAKREHQKNLPILLEQVLTQATSHKLEASDIDFIAVTVGPGLEPALWTGITFAQELGQKWGKPVLGANHMEGHIYSILAHTDKLHMPALALLVSGGHTEIVSIDDFGKYKLLGHTLDDAAGEAFDKCARMLGLPYPGGPEISKLAQEARKRGVTPSFKLPRPMLKSDNLNFSFSGLKTAVLYKIKEIGVTEETKLEMSLEFEDAVMDVLVGKTRKALEDSPETKSLIVAGGVAASPRLREVFEKLSAEYEGLKLHFPERELATDNAIMIGLASYVKVTQNPQVLLGQKELRACGNLSF